MRSAMSRELAIANIFMAKDGAVFTPVPNGTFLDGITRRRVIGLLRGAGTEVVETSLRYHDFENADENFLDGKSPQGAGRSCASTPARCSGAFLSQGAATSIGNSRTREPQDNQPRRANSSASAGSALLRILPVGPRAISRPGKIVDGRL